MILVKPGDLVRTIYDEVYEITSGNAQYATGDYSQFVRDLNLGYCRWRKPREAQTIFELVDGVQDSIGYTNHIKEIIS